MSKLMYSVPLVDEIPAALIVVVAARTCGHPLDHFLPGLPKVCPLHVPAHGPIKTDSFRRTGATYGQLHTCIIGISRQPVPASASPAATSSDKAPPLVMGDPVVHQPPAFDGILAAL